MTKFTADDVVIGSTITVRETWERVRRTVVTQHKPLVVDSVTGDWAFDKDGYHVTIRPGDLACTVEILDVIPPAKPEPEYVEGGIYRVTSEDGGAYLRRFKGGRFVHRLNPGAAPLRRLTPAELTGQGWTISERVLVIDYPTDEQVKTFRFNVAHTDEPDGDADRIIMAAIDKETVA